MAKNKREKQDGDTAAQQTEQQAEGAISLTAEQFDEIKRRIDEVTVQRDEYIQTAQRLQAEFDNFRKRNAAVRAESCDDGVRDAIKALLPFIDSMERAAASVKDDGPYAQGLMQLRKQLMEILSKQGLSEIDTSGKFDPELHEALMQIETEDGETGDIAEALQKGYAVRGRVIRAAMVKVVK